MASVWWARHELLGRDVALKLSPANVDDQVVKRFLREAKIIGKFRHRNIVGVVDAGELVDEEYLFLALELLHGAPLADRLVPNRPLAPEEIVPILIEVCRGLEAAHAAGVVHRDIKPENIFLAKVPGEGVVPKIVDFGISQLDEARDSLTLDGQLLGTPSYMSPEQALGKRCVDARADLWAIGVILYEALAGRQPFKSESHHAILRRIVDDAPAPLPASIDPRLEAIVRRCLQKEPARRYPSAAALRADLEAVLGGCDATEPILIIPNEPASGPLTGAGARRSRWSGALARVGEMRRAALARLGYAGRAPLDAHAHAARARATTAPLGAARPLGRGAALLRGPLARPTIRAAARTVGAAMLGTLLAVAATRVSDATTLSAAAEPGVDAPAAAEGPARAIHGAGGAALAVAARVTRAARATGAQLPPDPARAREPALAGTQVGATGEAPRAPAAAPAPAPLRPRTRITSPGF